MKLHVLLSVLSLSILQATAFGQVNTWYLELSGGPALSGDLTQVGFNFDSYCYPGYVCCTDGIGCSNGTPNQQTGYEWTYQIPTDPGISVQIGVGREQGRLRIDLSGQFSSRNLEAVFDQIIRLDGSPTPGLDPASGVDVRGGFSIGNLRVASLRINTFLNLLSSDQRIRPYLGLGTGAARSRVRDIYFEERYSCVALPCTEDVSSFDTLFDTDLEDLVLLTTAHVGFEYSLTGKLLAGLRLSYTLLQDISGEATYLEHKIEDLGSITTFSKVNLMASVMTIRYRL